MDFPRLDTADIISVDCETYDPDLTEKGVGAVRNGYIAGVALATREQQWYFPVAHEGGGNLDRTQVFRWLNDSLSTNIPKVGANLAYDVTYLWSEGVQIQGPFYDVQVAEPLLDENKFSYSLETLSQERLGIGKDEAAMCEYIRQHFGAKVGKEKSYIWKCPAEIIAPYAKQDVALPIKIFDQQIKELREQELEDLFFMETDLLPILVRMHLNGVRVDASYADQLSVEWAAHLATLEKQFNGINPGSSVQLAAYLDSIGVEYPRHPPTKAMLAKGLELGNPKLNAKVLSSLEDKAPLLKTISEAKKYRHFLNTFINGYIVNSHINGRVHGTFNQLKGDEYGTVTGRLSASQPNLQNIPNPEKDPYFSAKCRGMFLPEHGEEWLRYDFSQIEYRLLVHFANTLEGGVADLAVSMYKEDPETDFHQMCADLTGVSRKQAKNINFGLCLAEGSLVLTDSGLVPIEKVTTANRVWDGVEWVAHSGVVFNGYKEVITYDGVTATPEHIVFTEDGREISIREAASEMGGQRLATTGSDEIPIQFGGNTCRERGESRWLESKNSLFKLWERYLVVFGQCIAREKQSLQVFTEKIRRRQVLLWSLGEHKSQMQLPNKSSLQKLRWSWDKVKLQATRFYRLLQAKLQSSRNTTAKVTNRQDKQQWSLRTGEHKVCDTTRKPEEQETKKQLVKVYDIVDAGPRNRFTVNNKLVHNCYGMGVDKLAADLGLSKQAAMAIFKLYHAKAPFAKAFAEAASQRAGKRGYITTIGKRRRRFDFWESTKWLPKDKRIDGEVYQLKDKNEAIDRWGAVRRAGTHKAGNAVLQGSSADITKKAMVEGYKRGIYDVIGFPLVTVHDELGFSVATGDPRHEEAAREMKEIMETAYKLAVPVLVSDGRGKNWGEAG